MTDLSIEILEKLVLGEDKRAVLKEVTPHSEQARFLELLLDLREGKGEGAAKKLQELQASGGLCEAAAKKLWALQFFQALGRVEDKAPLLRELAERLKLEFSFPKPERVQGLRFDLIADSKDQVSSELQRDQLAQLTLKDFLARLYSEKNCALLDRFSEQHFQFVNLGKFALPADKSLLVKFFDRAPKLVEVEGAEAAFLELTRQKLENAGWWAKFSTEQKERLLKHSEVLHTKSYFQDFVAAKFAGREDEPLLARPRDFASQVDFLKKKLEFLRAAPKKYEKFYSNALAELLTLNKGQRVFDEALFLEYLKHPGRVFSNSSQEFQQQWKQYEEKNKLENVDGSNYLSDQSFIAEHLTNLLRTEADVKKYVEFFDLAYLNRLLVEARLLRGEEVADAAALIDQAKLGELHTRTVIDLRGNPLQFKPGEEVALAARLKNVSELKVRVFEINTLNFLLEKRSINFEAIQLAGLIPLQEELYSYKQRPIEEHTERFAFPALKSRARGVFVIEFVGGEVFAKAVLRLGWLKLIHDRVLGRSCVLLDEANRVCRGEKTGLYIKNKFFAALSDGTIVLPSNVENVNDFVVVCHDGFADFCRLQTQDNLFALTAHYIFNEEQFLPGSQVSMHLSAALFNNGMRVALSRVLRPELEVKLVAESGVENVIPIKNVELAADKDFAFGFLLPPKTVRVVLTLSGAVKLPTDELKLSSTKEIAIQRRLGDVLSNYFLKRDAAGEFTLLVLGLNGEPQKGRMLTATFNTTFSREPVSFKLMSDPLGRVYLHRLDDVRTFSVEGEDGSAANFAVEPQRAAFYPAENIVSQGHKFSFRKEPGARLKLYRVGARGGVEADVSKLIKAGERDFEFTLAEQGAYTLLVDDQSVNIVCLEGEKLAALDGYISAGGATVQSESDVGHVGGRVARAGDHFEGEVSASKGAARAYLLTYNFHPVALEALSMQRGNNRDTKVFTINAVENKYTGQAQLGDELVYVTERKARKNYMGNTLDKPGIILKRQKVSDTAEGEQAVRPQGQAAASASRLSAQHGGRPVTFIDPAMFFVNEVPFLARPGQLTPLPLADGKFVVPKELTAGFAMGRVLLHDGVSSVLLPLFSEDVDPPKSNLALKESRKEGCAYAYERHISYLAAGKSKDFKNLANTELSVVGDVSALWDTLALVREGGEDLAAWKFLADWHGLSPMDKLRNYDKFCSHELNLFVYFKDPEFFFEVVFPFISNKKEKTIIDLFLLKSFDDLVPFCNLGNLSKLPLLDLVFLCAGVSHTRPKFSAAIRAYLKARAALNKVPVDKRKRLFDSALSTKSAKDVAPAAAPAPASPGAPPAPPGQPPFMAQAGPTGPMGFGQFSNIAQMSNIAPASFSNITQMTFAAPGMALGTAAGGGMMAARASRPMFARPQQRGYATSSGYGYGAAPRAYEAEEDVLLMDSDMMMNHSVPVYTASQSTTEYKERKFYFESQNDAIEEFWVDLCEHLCAEGKNTGFASPNYIYACTSASKAIVILAVTDLEFRAAAPRFEREEAGLKLIVASPAVVFSKEIVDEKAEKIDLHVLVAQRFYDPQDQFIIDEESDGARIEKPVAEYIAGKVYGSRIVVTNSTTTELNLNLIYEIPQGALPIGYADQMKLVALKVGSFESAVNEFRFYFPAPGTFSIYPATVTKGNHLVAAANIARQIEVKETLTLKKDDTIVDILSTGDFDDIIRFVKMRNILNDSIFQFDQVYWLLKNKEFYTKLVEALREKGVFDSVVWAFALHHGDLAALREYLPTVAKAEFSGFKYLVNDFVSIKAFDFREYYPLVNPRAHALGGKKQNILNQSFKNTYKDFLLYLLDKWTIDTEDRIALTDYLILQDRMEEAMEQFAKITPAELAKIGTRIQYDYLAAYIDFLNGYPTFEVAKKLVDQYVVYPVLSWRNLFVEIANQLAEFEEREQLPQTDDAKKQSNQDKAKKSANFNCELNGDVLRIESDRIRSFTIKYYKIDLEVIFSQNPFRNNTDAAFTFVQPFLESTINVEVKDTTSIINYHIPKALAKESLFIELNHNEEGATKSKFFEYAPFLLTHSFNQEFGIVKLIDPAVQKPVPKIYVKCFAKYKNGSVAFYKDGYTDIRGSFDYASLSKDKIDDVEKFGLLITSPDFGSKIAQVDPPVKIGKEEGEAKTLVSKAFEQQRMTKKAMSKNAYAAVY